MELCRTGKPALRKDTETSCYLPARPGSIRRGSLGDLALPPDYFPFGPGSSGLTGSVPPKGCFFILPRKYLAGFRQMRWRLNPGV